MVKERAARWLRSYPGVLIRRARAQGRAGWVLSLPRPVRDSLDLDGDPISPLRVELGGGPFPSPGYVHVDSDRRARHLEYVAPVWKLPFPEGTVEEMIAIHVLEHVHPGHVTATIAEWKRVLKPGGTLRIHVPNAPAVFRAFEASPPSKKWALVGALFGMYCGPSVSGPDELHPKWQAVDHKAMYDFPLLESLLTGAGLVEVENLTGKVEDRHVQPWRSLVANFSLIVRARKAASG